MPIPQFRREKSRSEPVSFSVGPPIQPYGTLLGWLNGKTVSDGNSRRMIKLPVCIQRSSDVLGLGPAHIGTSPKDLEQGAIRLSLDDSALGVSLFSIFQIRCPEEASYCPFWLEGYWGPLLPSSFSDIGKASIDETFNIDEASAPPSSRFDNKSLFPFAILRVGDVLDACIPLHSSSESTPPPLTAFIC